MQNFKIMRELLEVAQDGACNSLCNIKIEEHSMSIRG